MIDFNEYNPDGGISDELLAAYLDGNTTPAETSWIESALQWDDSLAETLEIASDSRVAEEPGFVDAWQRAEADAWGQRMEWEPLSVGDSSTDAFKAPDVDDNDWSNDSSLDWVASSPFPDSDETDAFGGDWEAGWQNDGMDDMEQTDTDYDNY